MNHSKQTHGNQVTRTPAGIEKKRIYGTFSTGFADLVDRYKDSVVNIEVMQKPRSSSQTNRPINPWDLFFSQPRQEESRPQAMNIGTGFIFHEDGYILTNEHVVHGAEEVMIRLFQVKKLISAKVVATNYDLDLAILKAKLPKRTIVLPFGNSKDIRVGEWVLAIGNPFGMICYIRFDAWRNHRVVVAC